MRIIHRISISSSPEIQAELAVMGILVDASGLVTFETEETNENWPNLEAWIRKRGPADVVSTKFSEQELAEADWYELVPDWHHGYPQPEDSFAYRHLTYDQSEYCPVCGVGLRQRAPFRMKGEPKWGGRSIMQLNWIFDEFFVTPALWKAVFNPLAIRCRPVMGPSDAELTTVVQLVVKETVPLMEEGLPSAVCGSCDRTKYLPVTRGPFPPLAVEPSQPMGRTREWFGSGPSAANRVVVSKSLHMALAAEKVRGASVRPVRQVARPADDAEGTTWATR